MTSSQTKSRASKNGRVTAIGRNAGNGSMPVTSSRMLTVSETAKYLSVHPNSVRRWADEGLLSSYRIGRRGDRRFMVADVDAFMVSWKKEKR